MDLISNMSHIVWEFLKVSFKHVVLVAAVGPAVVENDVVISQVTETSVYKDFCSGEKQRFGDIAAEGVPVVLVETCELFGQRSLL